MKILVYGYGNPGRQDDALGVMFAEEIERWKTENNITYIDTDSNYQLNIEDAEIISNYDVVLFADASKEPINDFIITQVEPSEATIEFTMHAVSCAFVLDLCQKIYNKSPKTFLLHIKGYEWELQEGLTDKANENLCAAIHKIKPILEKQETLIAALYSMTT